jgi:hypothetical protein
MLMRFSFVFLFFANILFAQSWDWALSAKTDTLKRSYQTMRVELAVEKFSPALPKFGTPLFSQLLSIGDNVQKNSQVMWSKTLSGKIEVLWIEDALSPNKTFTYQLKISTTPFVTNPVTFKLTKNDSGIDILHGDKPVYRYQDIYDPDHYGETRKPFNHVYGSDGKYITKGNEGNYPHQRGIFMGWDINGHGYWTDGGGIGANS